MKKFVFVMILVAAIAGCKKSKNDLDVRSLYGTWELRTVSGGLAGRTQTYSVGNGNIITFNKDRHYTRVLVDSTGTKTYNGTFFISTVTYPPSDQKTTVLNFESNSSVQYRIEVFLRNDMLNLSDGYADGYTSTYIKR